MKSLFREAIELSHREGALGDAITKEAFAKVAVAHVLVSEHDAWQSKVMYEISEMILTLTLTRIGRLCMRSVR